jgi:ubiquinone/menaquinone biosynthesis C-methylase UbiE
METVASFYDEKAEKYDSVFDTLYFKVYDAVTWRHIEPYVPDSPEAMVLDAGGGTGRWALKLASKGCRVVLMDCSLGMLDVAKKRLQTSTLQNQVTLRKCDITHTSYPDETFDMVLCEHALFLFKNPDSLIGELRRVLKKDAPIVISAQNRYVQALSAVSGKSSEDNMERANQLLASEEQEWMTKDGSVKVYTHTPDEFRGILERNGLRVEKIVGKVVTMPLRIRQELFMEKKFSPDLLSQILQFEFAVCEKPDALGLAGHLQAIAYKI